MMNTLVLVCQKGKIPQNAAYHFTRSLLIAIRKHKVILFRNWDTTGPLFAHYDIKLAQFSIYSK